MVLVVCAFKCSTQHIMTAVKLSRLFTDKTNRQTDGQQFNSVSEQMRVVDRHSTPSTQDFNSPVRQVKSVVI